VLVAWAAKELSAGKTEGSSRREVIPKLRHDGRCLTPSVIGAKVLYLITAGLWWPSGVPA
jgi:hypothetical protein